MATNRARGGGRSGAGSRPRRSHAERTAATRARLLAAARESIAEVGLDATTASEITRRAGVTWGAVQHHFGDKDGILDALLADSFARFEARLSDVRAGDAALDERAALFVARAWEHFASAHYRSTFEILLRHAASGARGGAPDWRQRMFHAWDRVWRRLFADAPVPRRRHLLLQHYALAVLSGLATTLALEGDGAAVRPGELGLLARTLASGLAGGAP